MMASVDATKVPNVSGMYFRRPPMLRMSCERIVVVDAHVHRVDDAAGAEEEAGLEEGVREDVEEARGEGADADAEEHEAELAHGGVGEHLLDVVLDERDRRREERGERARERDRSIITAGDSTKTNERRQMR